MTTSSKPFFSVVMTGYNPGPFLSQSIESVLGQSFTDFELLIGDDASTDGMSDRVVEYDDPRIRLITSPVNVGGGENILNLIELALGEVIVELGADDYFYDSATLATIKHEYDTRPNLDATSGSFVIVPDTRICDLKPSTPWWINWTFCKPLTFRRSCWDRAYAEYRSTMLDPETGLMPRYGWDVALYYPIMAVARKHRHIHKVTYCYRQHEHNDDKGHRDDQVVTEHRMRDEMQRRFGMTMPWTQERMKAEAAKESN